eukprot:2430541-Prymnesium_polylepis.1
MPTTPRVRRVCLTGSRLGAHVSTFDQYSLYRIVKSPSYLGNVAGRPVPHPRRAWDLKLTVVQVWYD